MAKTRKPKPDDFAPLLNTAATTIDDVVTALNDALTAAKVQGDRHRITVLNRLVIHALAIGKGTRQLSGHPTPPAAPTPPPLDLNQKAT